MRATCCAEPDAWRNTTQLAYQAIRIEGALIPADELATMCRWHALPDNWWDMGYEQFLAARRPLIAMVIRDGYRRLAENTP